MNILLIAPPVGKIYGRLLPPSYPPLGLAYIGGILEPAGHVVNIVDLSAELLMESNLIELLQRKNIDLVGITTATPTFNNALRVAKVIKDYSKAKVVLGGIHATIMPEESISYPQIDFVVQGEGEATIVELAHCLENRMELKGVDGILFKENGVIVRNRIRELIDDLDAIPFPARHLFNQQNYAYPDTLLKPTFPIVTSRGCPANCTFCLGKNIFRRKFRMRSPRNVVDEIEYLINRFQAKEIHIWDDNFTAHKERVFQIRDEIERRGIKIKFAFPNGIRSDCVDEKILTALKDMGTYSVAFGVESGSQEVLDRAQKKTDLLATEEVFRFSKGLGLETWAFFMIGLPGESEFTIRETIKYAKRINPDVVKFHILKPFPGTEVYQTLSAQNLIFNTDFNAYGFHTPPVHCLPDLGSEDMLKWQKIAYRSFYLRPSVLVRQILRMRTLNRIKLNISTAVGILRQMI